jgi:hypothetical protein
MLEVHPGGGHDVATNRAAEFRVDIGRDDRRVTGLLGVGLVSMIVYLIAANEPENRAAGQPQGPVRAETT